MDRLKAMLKGAQQGATLQSSDELSGMIPAAMDKLGIGGGVTEQNKALAAQGFTGDIGPTNTEELYKQSRDDERNQLKQAQSEQPGAYSVGKLGGGLLSALAPGPSVLNAPSTAAAALRGGGFGALTGLGGSEATDTLGLAADVGAGAAIGATGGLAFDKLKGMLGPRLPMSQMSKYGKVSVKEGDEIVPQISSQQVKTRMEESGIDKILEQKKQEIGAGSTYDALKQKAIDLAKKDIINRMRQSGGQDNGQ